MEITETLTKRPLEDPLEPVHFLSQPDLKWPPQLTWKTQKFIELSQVELRSGDVVVDFNLQLHFYC